MKNTKVWHAIALCFGLGLICSAVAAGATPGAATMRWADRVLPLPKEMAAPSSVTVRADSIHIQPCTIEAPEMETAQALLKSFALAPAKGSVTISLHLVSDPQAPLTAELRARLPSLRNAGQAYAMVSSPERGAIALIANTPLGLLYAARTLHMLVQPPATLTPEAMIEMPLPNVVDWPDMEERGIWGMGMDALGPLARWKMNMMEMSAGPGCDAEGHLTLSLKEEVVRTAAAQGIKVIPYIPHVYIAFHGIVNMAWAGNEKVKAKYGPAMASLVDHGFLGRQQGFCMQHPITEQVLTAWLTMMAERVHTYHNDLEVWFSEGVPKYDCPKCKGKNPFLLELDCINRAFADVEKRFPAIRLRLFLSQGTAEYEDSNDKIVSALPAGIGLTYYHGQKTYLTDQNPMVPENLERFAKAGGRLGIVPSIGANIRTYVPFTSPQHVYFRMSEFVEKDLDSMSLYAPPAVDCYAFNIAMACEWSWNLKGRSMEDTARAYATITGMKNPNVFGKWAVLIGKPNRDLHEQSGRSFQTLMLLDHTDAFRAGARILDRFSSVHLGDKESFAEDLSAAEEALAMARQAGEPLMICESEYTLGMLKAYGALDAVTNVLAAAPDGKLDKEAAAKQADDLDAAAARVHGALVVWANLIERQTGYAGGPKSPNPDFANMDARLRNMTYALLQAADALRVALKEKGITDPRPETRAVQIGKWSVDDFNKGGAAKTIDVTAKVDPDGGFYHVTFDYVDGFPVRVIGVTVLLRDPGQEKGTPVSQSPDVWSGVERNGRFRHLECRIVIPSGKQGRRVLLEIPLQTGDKSRWNTFPEGLQGDQRVCDGEIGLRRVRRED